MDRLTHERVSGIKTGYWSPNKKDELIERLAAYENTGLMPGDIRTLVAQNQRTTISLPDGSWFVKDNDGNNPMGNDTDGNLWCAVQAARL